MKKYRLIILMLIIMTMTVPILCGMGQEDWVSQWTDEGRSLEEIQAEDARRRDEKNGTTPVQPVATAKPTPATTAPKPCSHTYTSELTTEPTCVVEGLRTFTCESCGATYSNPEPATAVHDFVEEIVKEPTCIEYGEKIFTCTMCEETKTEEIYPLWHKYNYADESNIQLATCVEEGFKKFNCELCGEEYVEPIKLRKHEISEWEISKANSIFTDGEQVKKCTVCGKILRTEVIESKYPMMYLFVGIATVGFAIFFIGGCLLIWSKENKKE